MIFSEQLHRRTTLGHILGIPDISFNGRNTRTARKDLIFTLLSDWSNVTKLW